MIDIQPINISSWFHEHVKRENYIYNKESQSEDALNTSFIRKMYLYKALSLLKRDTSFEEFDRCIWCQVCFSILLFSFTESAVSIVKFVPSIRGVALVVFQDVNRQVSNLLITNQCQGMYHKHSFEKKYMNVKNDFIKIWNILKRRL